MSASLLKKIPNALTEAPVSDNTVSALIQQLIHDVAASKWEFTEPATTPNEVMLDVEIDGVRCLLVRVRAQRQAHPSLSPRETEIARMVALGHPNKIIADILDISEWTVGTHLRRIFSKLGVNSRTAMVTRLFEDEPLSFTHQGQPDALLSGHPRPY